MPGTDLLGFAKFPVKKILPPHTAHFALDPLLEFKKVPVHNLVTLTAMSKKFRTQEVDNLNTPFIMIQGGQDDAVCTKTAKSMFFDIVKVQDKDLITYDDLTHMVIHDKEYLHLIQSDLISWFNTHC